LTILLFYTIVPPHKNRLKKEKDLYPVALKIGIATCLLKWLAYLSGVWALKLPLLSFGDRFQKKLGLTKPINCAFPHKNYFTGMAFNISRGSKLLTTA
jgi:hypothetical protein